jgi:hypothetical protein
MEIRSTGSTLGATDIFGCGKDAVWIASLAEAGYALVKKLSAGAIAIIMCVAPMIYAQNLNKRNGIRHVLLISIDGMYALDRIVIHGFVEDLRPLYSAPTHELARRRATERVAVELAPKA